MFRIIPFTIILLLFAAGSNAKTPFDQSYENLSKEDQIIVNSVRDIFLKNHIVLLKDISQVNKLIGATAKSDLEVITGKNEPEAHYELGVDTHEKEHLVVLILPAEKSPDGTYQTPTTVLRNKTYAYKVLHAVEIQGKTMTFSSSKLSDKKDSRIEIAPNKRVIKKIAEDLKGTVSGNSIKLP
ncbi:MAG: hypothetical protein H8E41_14355 [Desulfobulbaceae bacterium]|uniref:Uncharacterized protein n=1 Tax=Candidatus Desulfobia pelagia TaxID=2841692 RepID=A0A8J6TGM9_9BACT|nr:hypothetical protein [Candidatus Desulfobia pelagia]